MVNALMAWVAGEINAWRSKKALKYIAQHSKKALNYIAWHNEEIKRLPPHE